MDFLRTWFFGVAGAAAVGVFALAVTPPGAARKAVRIASALVLCIAVLRPLTGVSGDSLNNWNRLALAGTEHDLQQAWNGEILASIIEERTAAYIVNKAQALGLVVSVTARCRMGENWPEPWAVTIRHERPEHAKSALSKTIWQDLGIPLERQTYQTPSVR